LAETPDRFPGDSQETGLDLNDDGSGFASSAGQVRYSNGRFSLYDNVGEYDPRSGGGISESQHKSLRQLIHFVETNSPGDGFGAGPYVSEVLPVGDPFPTSETWYTDSGKTLKICKWEATYNANKTFATEKWTVYKSDGTNPAADATDTISYSGVFETGRSRAVAVY